MSCTCLDVTFGYLPNCPVHGHLSKEGDVHTMPNFGREHQASSSCWCRPHVVYIASNGNQQWLHQVLS